MEDFLEFLDFKNGSYKTGNISISLLARIFPSFIFYCKLLPIVFKASSSAKRARYGNAEWAKSSFDVLCTLESVGIEIEITGIDYFKNLDTPCIFIGNHMSTLETFVLPVIIQPFRDVTFVVKKSLVEYPVFKHVMRSRDPIIVTRTNPRDDFKSVMEGGIQRLKSGKSIVIFPQTTRTVTFNSEEFNTIGIKLAHRANVPIVPVALKTDAWGNGKILKDFGKIDPTKKVYFAFGEPLYIKDRGTEEHLITIEFITKKLRQWGCDLVDGS
ncbi:1-acyl-sn-glycerol-3-phosphate acyltransferase [Dissulfurispira thermophila]|uniref:1-acyl-sn-glycerol-3-phosphate acyltransferase n=2 Tax=root TaxID=1 RepID=A0A7G1H1N9_9BACT|nr:lysophospholipid acyltransferase family protein [Dissulfurispira thermophila]BCB96139.1 1-acyl-sn-glycerol-3-phosphate acyltransferase [Dissulfurispira thermophila]